MIPIKQFTRSRPAYFTGQLLDKADFDAEQDYQQQVSRHHTTKFHSWGVANGLTVALLENGKLSVAPGEAVDSAGRDLLLKEAAILDVAGFAADQPFYVLLSYEEVIGHEQHTEHGNGPTRVSEYSVV